jgi:molecular chaperone DnaK (HSP70)
MKLGIDFGTTRIVAAAADRGNYPLVGFETPDGQPREWFTRGAASGFFQALAHPPGSRS